MWFLKLSMMLYFQTVACLQLEADPVVLKDFNMSLVCRVSTKINFTINIEDPTGSIVRCTPTGLFPARCTQSDYAIDETAQTVTLTRLAALSDNGTWTCEYVSNPIQTTTKIIIVETLDPINGEPLHINTTAAAGETLTSATNDVFSAIYGCFSSAVTFKWKVAVNSWQIIPQASTVYTCATPGTSAYVSTQTASEIWSHVSSGSKQTLSVTVLTMDSYELSVSTFSVYFSKGDTTCWCGLDSEWKCIVLLIVCIVVFLYMLIHWFCCNANCTKCFKCWCFYESCYCKCPEKGIPCCPHHFNCGEQECNCCNPLFIFESEQSDGNTSEGTNYHKPILIPKLQNNVTPSKLLSDDTIFGDQDDSRNNSGSSNIRTPRSSTSVSDVHTMPSNKAPVSDLSQTPKGMMRPLPLPENYQPKLPDPSTGGNNKT